MNPYFQPNKDFCAGSTEHVVAVLLVTCLCLIATQLAKKSTPEKQDQITKGFAWALVFNVLIWQAVKSYVSFLPENDPAYVKYNWGEDLPLNPCNWLAFVALAYRYTKKEWLWPIMYFFVWVFTFNAIITPALYENFPHFNFCKFWISHTGLVMFVVHLLRLKAPELQLKNLFHAYGALQIFTILCLLINYIVGDTANYFFLAHKPFSASILDILGPWPWYIIQGDVIALGLFFLAWAPYKITLMVKQKRKTTV